MDGFDWLWNAGDCGGHGPCSARIVSFSRFVMKTTNRAEILVFLFIVFAALSPVFLMAKTVDKDEWIKSGMGTVGAATVAGIVQIYRTRKMRFEEEEENE